MNEYEPRDPVPPGHGEAANVGTIVEADVVIRRDTELMNASVQGMTEAGIDFVETVVAPIVVVDADRIIVGESDLPIIVRAVAVAGLVLDDGLVERLR